MKHLDQEYVNRDVTWQLFSFNLRVRINTNKETTVFSDVIKPKGRLRQIANGEVLWNIYIKKQEEKK